METDTKNKAGDLCTTCQYWKEPDNDLGWCSQWNCEIRAWVVSCGRFKGRRKGVGAMASQKKGIKAKKSK